MEIEYQNATIGLKNVTIGLKNAAIGPLKLILNTYKKNFQKNVTIGMKKRRYRADIRTWKKISRKTSL